MKDGLGLGNDEMSAIFAGWNSRRLESYLIEIAGDILAYRDEQGEAVVDYILDSAGQKGTGKWTVVSALDQGTPLTLIGEAVFARFLSALVDERAVASDALGGGYERLSGDRAAFLADLEQAVYAAKIVSYAQGFMLMQAAGRAYGWQLNLGGIALMWRGGCVIRAAFLDDIRDAFVERSRPWRTCCWPCISGTRCSRRCRPGGGWWPRPSVQASPFRPSAVRWRFSTATAAGACPPT